MFSSILFIPPRYVYIGIQDAEEKNVIEKQEDHPVEWERELVKEYYPFVRRVRWVQGSYLIRIVAHVVLWERNFLHPMFLTSNLGECKQPECQGGQQKTPLGQIDEAGCFCDN